MDSLPVSVGTSKSPGGLHTGNRTGKLLTRNEAAAVIGVSPSEIRRREVRGTLRPTLRNEKGWVMFDEEEVLAQAAVANANRRTAETNSPYTNEEAAKVFDALDAGKTLVQCVKECLVLPSVVVLLAEAYASLTGSIFVDKATVDAINVLPLEGAFPLKNQKELLEVLVTASADTCKTCNTRSRVLCKPCALKLTSKVERNAL